MKKTALIVLSIVLVLVILGGLGALNAQRGASARSQQAEKDIVKVERGEVSLRVIETGTVDAVRAVEIRSRASGRLAQLMVDEGDEVGAGELVAVIDPQETQLRVNQDLAQVRGARSAVARTDYEILQQEVSLREAVRQAELRVATLKEENKVQPTLTSSAIQQAKAQLEGARRQYEQLTRVTQPNQRVDLERQVADAEKSAELSEREYQRQLELEKSGYVAGRAVESARLQRDLDRSRFNNAKSTLGRLEEQQRLDAKQAEENVRALQASYERALAGGIQDSVKQREYLQAVSDLNRARAALNQIPALRQSKAQGQATVDQLNSVLEDSQRQLRETQVRAPFAGMISKRYIEVGDLVTALSTFSAGTPIVRLEDRSKMRVRLDLNEIDVARLRTGMKVKIEVDALPERPMTGVVQKISPASNAAGASTGTGAAAASTDQVVKYQVEVYIDTVPAELRTGMSAKCTMDVLRRDNVLRVPVAYVGEDEEGAFVMIAPEAGAKDAKPTRRKIKKGAATGAFVEVLDGVKEGDRLSKPPFTGPQRTGFIQTGDRE